MRRRLSEDEIRAFEAFQRAYAATSHALERVSETRGGLPLGEHFLLVQLARGPETGLRPTDLTTRSLLTKSGVTRALDRLEADGLVGRRVCPSDKRGYYVTLTNKGRHLLRRAAPDHIRAIAKTFADALTPEELSVVTAAMERIAASAS
jgi:DNA-binding MarR family transcriptional regulator